MMTYTLSVSKKKTLLFGGGGWGGTLECHEAASVYAILQSKCIILSVVLNVFQGHVIQAQIVFTRLWCEVSCKNLGVEKSLLLYITYLINQNVLNSGNSQLPNDILF